MSHHPPRRAHSTNHPPAYYYPHHHENTAIHNKHFDFPQPFNPYPQPSNSQQQQYYEQPMITGEHRIVENIPFDPPDVDNHTMQPIQQNTNYIAGPAMLPPHSAYQMHQHQQQMQWQQQQRYCDRKLSLQVPMRTKEHPRQNPQMLNFNAAAQPGHMTPQWNEHNGIPNNATAMQIPVEPQRKISPVVHNQMLSPLNATSTSQIPCGSQHVQSPALSSPMEVDRKPSASFIAKFSRDEGPRRDYKVPGRKASCMATKSCLRLQKFGNGARYTAPPMLPPVRKAPGLYCLISNNLTAINQADCTDEDEMPVMEQNDYDDADMSDGSPGLKLDDSSPEMVGSSGADYSEGEKVQPARKNGLVFMASELDHFTHEMQALRKESDESQMSQRRIQFDNQPRSSSRKESVVSEGDEHSEIEDPEYTDMTPHINFDHPKRNPTKKSEYQAKVNQWYQRDIHYLERYLLAERDIQLFNPKCVDQLTDEQITAYERLASSEAGNLPGYNKELALHFLSEHRGNLCSAVTDLLTSSNTLDWESFDNIRFNDYPEATEWTPEELIVFEESMFEFKKNFVEIQKKLPSKTVRECVEFYYTWKKASPEAYAKLKKNLRAQIGLEQAMNSDTTEALHKASLHDTKVESPSAEMSRLSTAEPYRGLEDFKEINTINVNTNENIFGMPNSVSPVRDQYHGMFANQSTPSPNNYKDVTGFQKTHYPGRPMVSSSGKKGAQPAADGLFHCRLCDKSFEKVKSLNAHMKSHAMKARAEQEAKSQVEQHMNQVAQPPQVSLNMNGVNNPFSNGLAAMNLQQLAQGLGNPNMPNLAQFQNLLNAQGSLNGLLNGNNQLISQITSHQPVIH